MSHSDSFHVLVRRVRGGDEAAAAELVRRYESELRIMARVRLTAPSLRRALDSSDVCQSVLKNLFAGLTAGRFDFETPDDLLKLLATMVRNRVADHARREANARNNLRRLLDVDVDTVEIESGTERPEQKLVRREFVEAVRNRLGPEELRLMDLRLYGDKWKDIARRTNHSPEALRKRLARAINRATSELDWDQADVA